MKRFCPECGIDLEAERDTCPQCGGAAVRRAPEERVGEVLDGRYTLRRVLGRGGMGVVYAAEQKYLGRDVALKVLRRELAADEAYVKRFLREARAVASLKSPHTITIHEFGITPEEELYFSMALLEGHPLSAIIERESPVEPARAAGLLAQACASLAEAHALGMVHRDLKPDNLFVGRDARGSEHVTVLDFGIAKPLGEAERLTATGMVCGTPHYLSPEQASGAELTPRADLYALGTILFELLTGRTPFLGSGVLQILMDQVRTPPPRLRDALPGGSFTPALEAFVARCLAKDPAHRPTDANAFARELEEALRAPAPPPDDPDATSPGGRQTPPPPAEEDADPAGNGSWPPAGRSSGWRRGVAAALVLGLVIAALAFWRPWEAERGETPVHPVADAVVSVPVASPADAGSFPDRLPEDARPDLAPDLPRELGPADLVSELPRDLGPADLVPELPPDLAQPDLAQEASAVAPDHGEGVPPDSVTDAESPDAGADRPPRDVRGEPAGGHRRPRDVTASPPEPIPSADADARPPEAPPADARPPEESANELFRLDRVRTEGEVKKTLFQLDPVPEGGRTP